MKEALYSILKDSELQLLKDTKIDVRNCKIEDLTIEEIDLLAPIVCTEEPSIVNCVKELTKRTTTL